MFIVEGNIGAGKSTFLTLLKQHIPAIHVSLEPVHNWQSDVQGQSLLTQFYQEPHRWAYTMETWALACRVREHRKDQEYTQAPLVVERSIYSGHYSFALNGYMNGFMTDMEWRTYSSFFDMLTRGCKKPEGFIYLHVEPETALARIHRRNRSGESGIPLSYLQAIDERHQEFLITQKHTIREIHDVPVLTLDCSHDIEKNPEIFYEYCDRVYAFIQNTLAHAGTVPARASHESDTHSMTRE